MGFLGTNNSKDNYGETNRVPPGSNEEKVRMAAQRTTGSQPIINNMLGDLNRKHILGKFDEVTKH